MDRPQQDDRLRDVRSPEVLEPLLTVRWRVNDDTKAAVVTGAAVVLLTHLWFQQVLSLQAGLHLLGFGLVTVVGLALAVPLWYLYRTGRNPLTALAITTERLVPSLILGLFMAIASFRAGLAVWVATAAATGIPVVLMALTLGLFEAVFFFGWLESRFDEAFGLIPGVMLGAAFYTIYQFAVNHEHVSAMGVFGVAVVLAVLFRLTMNVFVLWPFVTPAAWLCECAASRIVLPWSAGLGVAAILILMLVLLLTTARHVQRREEARRHLGRRI